MFPVPRSAPAATAPAALEPLEPRRLLSADLFTEYEFRPLKIGGGGWVTGIVFNETAPGLAYARTDVGGAYRLDPGDDVWEQLVDANSLPASEVRYRGQGGVLSIATAASNPDVAYMMFDGGVWRSDDRGTSWQRTALSLQTTDANGPGRYFGERLAVDPLDADVVYAGTLRDGLWTTTNGGGSWARAWSVPAGSSADHGITGVIFSDAAGSAGGRTLAAYATVWEGGIWQTLDGGQTWTNVADQFGPGSDRRFSDVEVAADGQLWVTMEDGGGAGGGIWRYDLQLGWRSIPFGSFGVRDVALDPTNASRAHAFLGDGATFYTTNRGSSWRWVDGGRNLSSPEIPWLASGLANDFAVGEVAFDPHAAQPTMWAAQGVGVWASDDAFDRSGIDWTSRSRGIEEMVTFDVVAPPDGDPQAGIVTAVADRAGFYQADRDAYPIEPILTTDFVTGTDVDFSHGHPNFLVATARSHFAGQRDDAEFDASGWSDDGGRTWTTFGSITGGTHPDELRFGSIAVASGTVDHIAWVPVGFERPFYTTDRGQTWTQVRAQDFPRPDAAYNVDLWSTKKTLAADPVRDNTFYLLHEFSGEVIRSTDGGRTWHVWQQDPDLRFGDDRTVLPMPGSEGVVFLTNGDTVFTPERGLYRATDAGVTRIDSVDEAYKIAFGAPLTPGGTPGLFLVGRINAEHGLHVSYDGAATWERIAVYPAGLQDRVNALAGDPDQPGTVYVGFGGNSFVYGTRAADTTAPAAVSASFEFETRQAVTVTFDEPLAAPPVASTVPARLNGSFLTVLPSAVEASADLRTVTFVFDAPLDDGDWTLTLPRNAILDAVGNRAADDLTHDFFVLAGDADRDRRVDLADFGILRANFGRPGSFSQGDFDYDGTVSLADFGILRANFGTVISTPAPSIFASDALEPDDED